MYVSQGIEKVWCPVGNKAPIIAHCSKPWRATLFNRILVALDLSPAGQEVLEKGLSLARAYGASLLLLHVLSAEEEGSPLPIPVNMDEIYPAAGNELTMEVWQQQWQTFEQECQAEQILGSPGKTICQRAKQDHSDIIVVGHRGRWGLGEILLGSVGNYVFHHAHCCVFVVPTPD